MSNILRKLSPELDSFYEPPSLTGTNVNPVSQPAIRHSESSSAISSSYLSSLLHPDDTYKPLVPLPDFSLYSYTYIRSSRKCTALAVTAALGEVGNTTKPRKEKKGFESQNHGSLLSWVGTTCNLHGYQQSIPGESGGVAFLLLFMFGRTE
ncbi:uncharacterized protein Z519_01634 [Cladophialophora bantiana CBS 173.52]|uniref:Uncharacterized protein n=1 Tax=Cladophialophora bantiana (strain ATCC 10958 / CBS 173.52 / CDC B-1940 / NIH 8579) TaxID=1442370 RepID=A0A0D2I492_CLAB1|nr:uncharacterized protein Z519_01634 [Cladophialophora bantiana CBS 173.52]KIW98050.1 hypothetical protein Z519_01634 [Cladophialophora bantiana CBS 173.52]